VSGFHLLQAILYYFTTALLVSGIDAQDTRRQIQRAAHNALWYQSKNTESLTKRLALNTESLTERLDLRVQQHSQVQKYKY
jgi:hypothetical protein